MDEIRKGGRQKLDEDKVRTCQIKTNLTKDERDKLMWKAKHYGMTMSSYVQKLILQDFEKDTK